MIKQYILLRKKAKTVTGEPVSAQKLAVMASHSSMAFLSTMIRNNTKKVDGRYHVEFDISDELFEGWLNGSFTKVLLEAKNLNDLNKAIKIADEIGLKEGIDYFCIRDNCCTELVPDEGESTCFIGIGFRPMDVEKIKPLARKFQLYK